MRRTGLTRACVAALVMIGSWAAAGTLPASAQNTPDSPAARGADSAPASTALHLRAHALLYLLLLSSSEFL